MPRSVRVLVANRHKLMRELIASTLMDARGVDVVGEVAGEAEIAEQGLLNAMRNITTGARERV